MSAADLLFAIGFCAFSAGLWMIAPHLALACGGALLMLFAVVAAMRGAASTSGAENRQKGGNS